MKKKVSLKDIAQQVGVSTALVSYVLNNKKVGRISKEITQKIKEAAKELNYRTNQIARSLKTSKTNTIGVMVSDISNPFSSSLARIIEDEAEKNGYTVIFCSSDENAERSEKLINVLLNHQVDGLIIAPADHSEYQIAQLQQNEVPFVLIDRYFPQLATSYVAIDNYSAAYTAVRHLMDGGHKKIGMITFNNSLYSLQERKRGYMAALKSGGYPVKKKWIKEVGMQSARSEVEAAIHALLFAGEPVDAILFGANTISTRGLKYINALALKVPEEVAILSFDQSDAAEIFYAPLTYIKQPINEMGRQAVQFLIQNMNGANQTVTVNMKAELIIGKSTQTVRQETAI